MRKLEKGGHMFWPTECLHNVPAGFRAKFYNKLTTLDTTARRLCSLVGILFNIEKYLAPAPTGTEINKSWPNETLFL